MGNFLSNILGGATEVYIAVSTTNTVEFSILDPHTHLIKTYLSASIEYNEATREISDYDFFRAKIEKMFEESDLQPSKCNIHISIPTVWFGFKDNIPITSDNENIKNIVFNELDQTYIFKRTDPVPCWFDAPASLDSDTKSIFYTAIQADVIETLRTMFKEMGANLIEITCSLISDLKGLMAYGITDDLMNSEEHWNLMILNNSGFQLYGFRGKKLTDYYEEPLPIKSLDNDEIYTTVENAAQIALMSSSAQSLVLVSETGSISAGELAKRLQFGGKIKIVEDSSYRRKPISDIARALIPEVQSDVSLSLLGMFPDPSVFPMYVNFLLYVEGFSRNDVIEIPISSDKVIVLTRPKAMLYSLALLLLLGLPTIGGAFGTHMINQKYTSHIEELESDITDVDAKLKQYNERSGPEFNPYKQIEKVVKNNRTKIMAYSALGESIPQNLYLSYFMTGDEAYIDIQGYSSTVEDVYVFFENLKDSLVGTKLRLSKLDMQTSSLEDIIQNPSSNINSPYIFEITNMDEGQLSSFMNALRGASQQNDDKPKPDNNDKKKN